MTSSASTTATFTTSTSTTVTSSTVTTTTTTQTTTVFEYTPRILPPSNTSAEASTPPGQGQGRGNETDPSTAPAAARSTTPADVTLDAITLALRSPLPRQQIVGTDLFALLEAQLVGFVIAGTEGLEVDDVLGMMLKDDSSAARQRRDGGNTTTRLVASIILHTNVTSATTLEATKELMLALRAKERGEMALAVAGKTFTITGVDIGFVSATAFYGTTPPPQRNDANVTSATTLGASSGGESSGLSSEERLVVVIVSSVVFAFVFCVIIGVVVMQARSDHAGDTVAVGAFGQQLQASQHYYPAGAISSPIIMGSNTLKRGGLTLGYAGSLLACMRFSRQQRAVGKHTRLRIAPRAPPWHTSLFRPTSDRVV